MSIKFKFMPIKLGELLAAIGLLLPCLSLAAQNQFTVLHNFNPSAGEGGGLWNSVSFDASGNIYGTTSGGGDYGYGTVFQLSPNSDGTWNQAVVHSFANGDVDGYDPLSNVIFDSSGNLYATTQQGGSGHLHGGTVFEMSPGTSGWTLKVLHNFGSTTTDGGSPKTGVVMDKLGNIYGVADYVFELTPTSTGWQESVLYRFCSPYNCVGGSGPYAGVILDSSGNLLGLPKAGARIRRASFTKCGTRLAAGRRACPMPSAVSPPME
ncbi:MAG TPA: choice-of-anchor tandem repeat GloVer-containing protein [Candidatus Sulfotelmatobacter sp.]